MGVKNNACNTSKTSMQFDAITVLLTIRGFLLTWSGFVPASVS